MKTIVADAHVHVYPCYRMEAAFRSAWTNLDRLASVSGDRIFLLFLTERAGCRFFHDVVEGQVSMPGDWQAKSAGDEDAFCVQRADHAVSLCILNGRQIATRERLEVLALTGDPKISDGQEARHVIEAILSTGAIPVLPWAPGKWLFERGRTVADLLRVFHPGQLLIGDTTLRPAGFCEPRLMREARDRGFKIIAGTDPLPFAGEELGIGRYGVTWQGELGEYSLVRDIRKMLQDPQCVVRTVGCRDGLPTVVRRLVRNHQSKSKA